jgi:hypothetical protein
VSRELDSLIILELQGLLEPLADLVQHLATLLNRPALGLVGLAYTSCPETDTVEATPNVDNDAHHLVIFLILKVLADGCEHNVEPERIDVDCLLVLELEGPLATVLVLAIFPFGADALFEEMVVGLECQVGRWCDVVLREVSNIVAMVRMNILT